MISIEYLEHLWFVMHHSNDPQKIAMALTCYLDESGTDKHSPQAVLAGLIMHRDSFLIFDTLWNDILIRHGITPPLHMKEFGQHGRHGNLTYDQRYALFNDLANFINAHKTISIAVTLKHEQFEKNIHDDIKKDIGLYGACFMLCGYLCFQSAYDNFYTGNIAFVMEAGNRYAEYVRRAHRTMIALKKTKPYINAGSLTFSSKELSVIQAADIIAWGINRRDNLNKGLGKGFQPISKIFNNKKSHLEAPYPDELLSKWSNAIMECCNPTLGVFSF